MRTSKSYQLSNEFPLKKNFTEELEIIQLIINAKNLSGNRMSKKKF